MQKFTNLGINISWKTIRIESKTLQEEHSIENGKSKIYRN